MIDALSIYRFHDLVASYGADPERWPADQSGGAVRCLVDSEAARAAWCDAADLDANLDSVPGLDISPDLVERVLAIAEAPEKKDSSMLSSAMGQVLPYAAAAAIALAVGLAAPSPFRDSTGTSLRTVATVSEPELLTGTTDSADIDDGLTKLALVDVRSFANEEADTGEALSNDNQLFELPLL